MEIIFPNPLLPQIGILIAQEKVRKSKSTNQASLPIFITSHYKLTGQPCVRKEGGLLSKTVNIKLVYKI